MAFYATLTHFKTSWVAHPGTSLRRVLPITLTEALASAPKNLSPQSETKHG